MEEKFEQQSTGQVNKVLNKSRQSTEQIWKVNRE